MGKPECGIISQWPAGRPETTSEQVKKKVKYDNADSYSIGSGSTSDNIRNLEIDWVSGNVEISYGKGDEIVFEETSKDEITDEPEKVY